MNIKQLNRLVRHHKKVYGLRKPSVSAFARLHGLHPSSLNKIIAGKRDFGPVLKWYLDSVYLTTVF